MDEGRVLIVVMAAVLAIGAGRLTGRGKALVRRPRRFPGLEDGLYLFTSNTCTTCSTLRRSLEDAEVAFVEIGYEQEPSTFERLRIDRVPAIGKVSAERGWLGSGLVSQARLRRWLSGP